MSAKHDPAASDERGNVLPFRRDEVPGDRPEREWATYDELASEDAFTGLAGHPWFEDDLRGAARRRRGDENPWVAVALAEGLDEIDARLGPAAAGKATRAVAVRLRDSLRAGDKIARLGRETFGLIVDAPYADEALTALERIEHSIRRLVDENPRWEGLHLRVGLAPLWSSDPSAALTHATEALERARAHGGAAVAMTTASRPPG
jgi:diguanylate cyclase (GGDEF)-like protein